jgi:ribosome assembly protein YihI (activator of Der GTPase)
MLPFLKRKKDPSSPERAKDAPPVFATPVRETETVIASPSQLLSIERGGKRLPRQMNTATVFNQFEEMKRHQGLQRSHEDATPARPRKPSPVPLSISYVIILSALTATIAALTFFHIFGGRPLVYELYATRERLAWTEHMRMPGLRGPNELAQRGIINQPLWVDLQQRGDYKQADAIKVSIKVFLLQTETVEQRKTNSNLGLAGLGDWAGSKWGSVHTHMRSLRLNSLRLNNGDALSGLGDWVGSKWDRVNAHVRSLSLKHGDAFADLGDWAGSKWGRVHTHMRSLILKYEYALSVLDDWAGSKWDRVNAHMRSLRINTEDALSDLGYWADSKWDRVHTHMRIIILNTEDALSDLGYWAGSKWDRVHMHMRNLGLNHEDALSKLGDWAGSKWDRVNAHMRSLILNHEDALINLCDLGDWAGTEWDRMKMELNNDMHSLIDEGAF